MIKYLLELIVDIVAIPACGRLIGNLLEFIIDLVDMAGLPIKKPYNNIYVQDI